MARLPDATTLQRRRASSGSPGISVRPLNTGVMAEGTRAIADGMRSLAGGMEAQMSADNDIKDYETKKRLLDFRLETETALEEHRRKMPAGGAGFADSWQKEYSKRAAAFVGRDDANIPTSLRGPVGLQLKQHETSLYERAHAEEWKERDLAAVEGLEQTLGVTRSFVEADPSRRDEMRSEGEKLIDASPITPAAKDRLRRHFSKELDKTAITTRVMKAQTFEDYNALLKDLAPEAPDPRTSSVVRDKITTGNGGKPAGWAATNPMWNRLDSFQKAAAMALLEADGANQDDAKNALGAMINRAAKSGEDLGAHVSQSIYQPTIEPAQEKRLSRILMSPKFADMTEWAKRRADGQEADPVNGATHFLASEKTMLALEAQDPRKYKSWRKWTNFDGKEYKGVITRDGSHAFLAPDGAAENGPISQDGTYGGPYANLTLTERKAFWQQAVAQREKAIGKLGDELKGLEENALVGHLIPEPMLADLGKRIEAAGDGVLTARLQTAVGRAKVVNEFQQRSPAANEMLLNRARAEVAVSEPTPENLKALQDYEQLVSKQRAMVQDDVLTWAVRAKAHPVEAIDWQSDESMKARLDHAVKASQQFEVPVQYFTKPERDAIAADFKAGGDKLIATATRLASSWGTEHAVAAMREVAPKAPEAAVAGYMIASDINPTVGVEIATALKRRQEPTYKSSVPKRETEAEVEAQRVLGDVYKDFPPQQRDMIMAAADALYETRTKGTPGTWDPATYEKGLREIVGQREDKNGVAYGGVVKRKTGWFGKDERLILPSTWRQDTWKDALEQVTTADLAAAGLELPTDASGKPLSMTQIANGGLVQVGSGQYHVTIGDKGLAATAPRYMQPSRAFVLDLNRLAPVLKKRLPGAFWPQ